jgi:hypothetical protein
MRRTPKQAAMALGADTCHEPLPVVSWVAGGFLGRGLLRIFGLARDGCSSDHWDTGDDGAGAAAARATWGLGTSVGGAFWTVVRGDTAALGGLFLSGGMGR